MPPVGDHVLVVDDDPDIRSALRDVLSDNGFVVSEASTGAQAKALSSEHDPDVILLDLGLPDLSGLDVLVDLAATGETPVIVLSGRSGETDAVVGLELGADDYITKPFGERELIARVNAALRRRLASRTPAALTFGPLVIDERTHDVTIEGQRVEMTPKEFALLSFLARSPRQVFSRQQLLQGVWGSSPNWQSDSTVAEHVHRLRRKLDEDHRQRWIETVRGVGYRFTPQAG